MEGKVTESKVGLSEPNITVVHYHCWTSKRVQLVWEWGPEWEDFNQRTKKTLKRLPGSPDSHRGVSTAVLLCTGRQVSRSYMVLSDCQKEFNSLPCQLVRPCDRIKVRHRCSLSSSTVTGLTWLFSGDPVEGACWKWVAKCLSPTARFLCWEKRRWANQGVGGRAAAVKFPENAWKGNAGPQGRQLMVFKLQLTPSIAVCSQRWNLGNGKTTMVFKCR